MSKHFNLIRCNGEQRLQLVATGSTTPEALERLQAAAAVAGWERFVVPPPRPSRLLLEDRSSLLPAVAAVRRPVICTATTVVVQVRPFSRHLAFLAARSEPLNREHRWSRTIHSLQWPLLQCQCPVTAGSPRSATQPVMPRYRVLLPVPPVLMLCKQV